MNKKRRPNEEKILKKRSLIDKIHLGEAHLDGRHHLPPQDEQNPDVCCSFDHLGDSYHIKMIGLTHQGPSCRSHVPYLLVGYNWSHPNTHHRHEQASKQQWQHKRSILSKNVLCVASWAMSRLGQDFTWKMSFCCFRCINMRINEFTQHEHQRLGRDLLSQGSRGKKKSTWELTVNPCVLRIYDIHLMWWWRLPGKNAFPKKWIQIF